MSNKIQILPFNVAAEALKNRMLSTKTAWKTCNQKRDYLPDSDDKYCDIDIKMLNLPDNLESRLYEHQKSGVLWLYSCYLKQSGGLLGDDMGMGKTFQVTTLLCGLIRNKLIKRTLIICPLAVLESWRRELHTHLQPHVTNAEIVVINSEMPFKKRNRILQDAFDTSRPIVVISSYQLVSNMIDSFVNIGMWDYTILDEGHTIKNPSTKTSKAMTAIRCHHRLLLTGTPVQNNLEELWCLIDWVTKGALLGSKKSFKETFITPILAGQNPKASAIAKKNSQDVAMQLLSLIQPILLQRKKQDHTHTTKLTEKTEIIVWIPLSTIQRLLYEEFIRKYNSNRDNQEKTTYPIGAVNHLKTLCRHPLLLEVSATSREGCVPTTATRANSAETIPSVIEFDGDDNIPHDDIDNLLCQPFVSMNINQSFSYSPQDQPRQHFESKRLEKKSFFQMLGRNCESRELLKGSIKLRVLLQLCKRLHRDGHRMLIFSQSKLMLDIIKRILASNGLACMQIDGSITGVDRQTIIDSFNAPVNDEAASFAPSILLLTTKACGYGITLTGADRVIIYDPSWNPAEDRQAVDRAFRIGQKKDVFVYRFVMASTVEEKMYEKQVFKDGVRVLTEKGSSSRYFSDEETKKLLQLGPADRCEVYEKLPASSQLQELADTDGPLERVLGYSRHDILYDEKATATKDGANGTLPLSSYEFARVASNVFQSDQNKRNGLTAKTSTARKSKCIICVDDDDDVDVLVSNIASMALSNEKMPSTLSRRNNNDTSDHRNVIDLISELIDANGRDHETFDYYAEFDKDDEASQNIQITHKPVSCNSILSIGSHDGEENYERIPAAKPSRVSIADVLDSTLVDSVLSRIGQNPVDEVHLPTAARSGETSIKKLPKSLFSQFQLSNVRTSEMSVSPQTESTCENNKCDLTAVQDDHNATNNFTHSAAIRMVVPVSRCSTPTAPARSKKQGRKNVFVIDSDSDPESGTKKVTNTSSTPMPLNLPSINCIYDHGGTGSQPRYKYRSPQSSHSSDYKLGCISNSNGRLIANCRIPQPGPFTSANGENFPEVACDRTDLTSSCSLRHDSETFSYSLYRSTFTRNMDKRLVKVSPQYKVDLGRFSIPYSEVSEDEFPLSPLMELRNSEYEAFRQTNNITNLKIFQDIKEANTPSLALKWINSSFSPTPMKIAAKHKQVVFPVSAKLQIADTPHNTHFQSDRIQTTNPHPSKLLRSQFINKHTSAIKSSKELHFERLTGPHIARHKRVSLNTLLSTISTPSPIDFSMKATPTTHTLTASNLPQYIISGSRQTLGFRDGKENESNTRVVATPVDDSAAQLSKQACPRSGLFSNNVSHEIVAQLFPSP